MDIIEELKNKNSIIEFSIHKNIFGNFLIATMEDNLCTLIFNKTKKNLIRELIRLWPNKKCKKIENKTLHKKILNFFDNRKGSKNIKIYLEGTDFQKKVWKELILIKRGDVKNYVDIAINLGDKHLSRAVGNAISKNKIAIIIPCHRVIKKDGSIGEYRWGKELKYNILKSEEIKL